MNEQPTKKRPVNDEGMDNSSAGKATQIMDAEKVKRVRRTSSTNTSTPQHVVVHRADYFDVPRLFAGANRATGLGGRQQLLDINGYLEDHSEICFTVYILYSCNLYHDGIRDTFERLARPDMDPLIAVQTKPYFYVLTADAKPATAMSEKMMISRGLEEALKALRKLDPKNLEGWDASQNFEAPYLQLYHCKHLYNGKLVSKLSQSHQSHLLTLSGYLEDHFAADYNEAIALFERGVVSRKHWAKLFRPGEIIVTDVNGKQQAYILKSCPTPTDDSLVLHCWSWEFEGSFYREEKELLVHWPSTSDVIPISDLEAYPLRYDKLGLEEKLRQRGQTFWTCRHRNFVSYLMPQQVPEIQSTKLRFMVDMITYKLMHTEDEAAPQDDLGLEAMQLDDPPKERFILLLPATIRGYGFHNKKWVMLLVKHIHPVEWNKEAFDHRLVLKEEKKELIRALITVHIAKGNTVKTDFMEGKGEGLIILLHGGPGTGKTLTAETVAELAQRPLYRVTCGDIGTDPESVEKYLESVLFIGTTWGCVVLLDEADIFLEARTQTDLQRNAMVSVFLRVLDYYEGILILTTNRIGTFDEAFKSRIQLALHYPPLDEGGRWEIWKNFLQALHEGGENINYEEIDKKLAVLARHRLNGRQIRNTMNTGKQLARYKGETLRYCHIDQAVRVVNDFERYVLDVHGHEDEEFARAQGNR